MRINYLHIVLWFYLGLGIIIGTVFFLLLPLWIPIPKASPAFAFACVLTGISLGFGHYLIFSIFTKKFIQHFQDVLKSVRNGDLSARSNLKSTGMLADLRKNVNETIETLQKTQKTMLQDDLTKLPNRSALVQFFNTHESSYDKSYALYFLDIDCFKTINDTYGHLMGDQVLKYVANTVRVATGKNGRLYRLSGDEFVITHQTNNPNVDIPKMCSQIHSPFKQAVTINETQLDVHISVGVYEFQFGREVAESILDKADQAMYDAKVNNKNHVRYQEKKGEIPS